MFLSAHDPNNLAEILSKYIHKFDLGLKISGMTANNSSVNGTIDQLLSQETTPVFTENQLMAFCANVINIAAKQVLKRFGDNMFEDSEPLPPPLMIIINSPENSSVKLKTIYACIHGLDTYTQETPQRGQTFANVIAVSCDLQKDPKQVIGSCSNLLDLKILHA